MPKKDKKKDNELTEVSAGSIYQQKNGKWLSINDSNGEIVGASKTKFGAKWDAFWTKGATMKDISKLNQKELHKYLENQKELDDKLNE